MSRVREKLGDDLLWAGYLFLLAVIFGLIYQWPLVRMSMRGGLQAHLEETRERHRAVEFKGVPTVSLKEAHDLWQEGQTLFLDARPAEEFVELHIPRALNLPPEKMTELQGTGILGLPRDRRIVVYCSKKACNSALKTAKHLQTLGFTRVMAFLEGFQGWDEAGYEVDTSL